MGGRKLLFPLVLFATALALMGATKVQILIYKEPGFQGDWAQTGRQTGEQGTPVPYWREGSSYTWIKVDLGPGTNVLYIYYGSNDAPDESDGEAVFEFFDDFDGTDLDLTRWTQGYSSYGAAYCSVSDGLLHLWSDGNWRAMHSNYEVAVSDRVVVEEKVCLEGIDGDQSYLYFVSSDNADTQRFGIKEDWRFQSKNANMVRVQAKCNSTFLYSPHLGGGPELYNIGNDWHIARITKSDDYTFTAQILDLNYNQLGNSFTDTLSGCTGKWWTPYFMVIFSPRLIIDWVRIRKHTPSPPSVSYGPEEAGDFLVDGCHFTKRRKVEITSNVALTGYQIALDYAQCGAPNIKILKQEE